MGLIAFLVLVLVVAVIGAVAVMLLRLIAPSAPALFERIIWLVCMLVVVLVLAQALGLWGHDIQIPRVR